MDPRVSDLLLRWREAREQGQPIPAEGLCAGSPELLQELRRAIRVVEAMELWLGMGAPAEGPELPVTGQPRTISAGATAGDGGPLPSLPSFTVPGYEVLGVLDQGGMGIVYRARQARLKRQVAVKMMRGDHHVKPQQLARFRVEAEAVAHLQHPNIVQIYEVGETEGRPYFSMELVEGGSLARLIGGKPLPPRQAAELVATLAETIHFAHQRGIVHRDLKPSNVLLQIADCRLQIDNPKQGTASPQTAICNLQSAIPKITDFGLAKLLNTESGISGPGHSTQSGMILGTPSYMAPEQAEGRTREIGPAVDVYSLGAILYEMLTGRPPFVGTTPLETLLRVVSSQPIPPSREEPAIPRDLETICLKCLEKAPGHRYPTAAALAGDLRRFLGGLPITARPLSPLARLLKWARRRPEMAALLATVVLSVLGLAIVLGIRYHEQQESRRTAERLAPRAREILFRYCYHCHGDDKGPLEGDLTVLDYTILADPKRKLVVPGDVEGSRLIHRIEDGSMPPEEEEEFPRMSSDELEDLKKWVAGGAPAFAGPGPDLFALPGDSTSPLAAEVKKIFQAKCHDCHRAGNVKNGIKVLNHDLLVAKRKVIVPGNPEQSPLFRLLVTRDKKKKMPPLTEPPLTAGEIETIRQWIAEGAPPFTRVLAADRKPE